MANRETIVFTCYGCKKKTKLSVDSFFVSQPNKSFTCSGCSREYDLSEFIEALHTFNESFSQLRKEIFDTKATGALRADISDILRMWLKGS